MTDLVSVQQLMDEAAAATEFSYSPYSGNRVGAALASATGRVYSGANIGNACSTLNCCAEQAALIRGLMDGERDFVAIAVTQAGAEDVFPCGRCLQLLAEFADEMTVIIGSPQRLQSYRLKDLLPHPFERPAEEVS